MRLTADRLSALRALRAWRRTGRPLPETRCDLPAPDPSPQQRWTRRALPLERLALDEPPTGDRPLEIVVPSPADRPKGSFFSCTVRSSLPSGSFVCLRDGLFVPCPELLFLELAEVMDPKVLALLGYELCGTFSRDPRDPRGGDPVYGISPVTSVEKIAAYLDSLGWRRSALLAGHALRRVADNAWSPPEAVIALMARLPVNDLGYELGEVALNVRHGTSPELVALGCRDSRVPDIEVVGTRIGFNYDSRLHLDLESVASAARDGDARAAMRAVRGKHHDDIKRNRELAAQGRIILPVTTEDLYEPGGLDAVMVEAAMTIRQFDGGHTLQNVMLAVLSARERQQLLRLLLPPRQINGQNSSFSNLNPADI